MNKLKANLRFVYVVWMVIWFCAKGLIVGLFGGNREKYYWDNLHTDTKGLVKKIGATVELQGLENLDSSRTYIVMANHRSYTDILAIYLLMATANIKVSFMSKKEIFNVPILGTAMKTLGTIGVERGDASKSLKSFQETVKSIKNGRSIAIFPEGTRSVDGKLHPLKRGAFLIAARTGAPIAPCVIHGTEVFMPKSGFGIYPTHISIKVLPIIETAGKKEAELMELVEQSIKSAL